MSITNRPLKFGPGDRREYLVEDSEVALIAINDTSGNPIFLGRAKVGTSVALPKWQIRKITYDANSSVTQVQWPVNSDSAVSSDYEYTWSSKTDLTITGISKASTAVVTVADIGTLTNSTKIIIRGVSGMTAVNFTGSNIYTVAGIAGNTFQLTGINSSAFSDWTAGGTVTFGEVVNYTYS